MSDTKKGWTAERVRAQLQNAIYTEMWTVPLYLTAAYSINAPVQPNTQRPEFVPTPTKADGSPDFGKFTQSDYNQFAFNNILSVAIQEMLHLEIAANVLNAVRPTADSATVSFTGPWAPDYTKAPACLAAAQLPPGVTLQLGPLDSNQIRLFTWVETDQPETGDPEEYRDQFDSIGNFYTALQYGLTACWDELYPPQGITDPTADALWQKDDWQQAAQAKYGPIKQMLMGSNGPAPAEEYKFSIQIYGDPKTALKNALTAIDAIKGQGEGAGKGGPVPDPYQPAEGDGDPIEIGLDAVSHWTRFSSLIEMVDEGKIELISVSPTSDLPQYQQLLNQSYSGFMAGLDTLFAGTSSISLGAMQGLGSRTLLVWQNGGTPEYTWVDPSSYIDPTNSKKLHSCQGLNLCQGLGVGGGNACLGLGDCATAWAHTCGSSNSCAGQAGCGYLGDNNSNALNWTPGYNHCKALGGCGSPIPAQCSLTVPGQVFNNNPSQGPVAPNPPGGNTSVWSYAREYMRQNVSIHGKTFPATDPEPNAFRAALSPTSSYYDPSARAAPQESAEKDAS